MISDSKQRKIGVILQYIQMGLSAMISLVYTPIMLKLLGQTEYGIYSVAQSTIAYLSLLSLGIGASYLKFYSKYKSKDNEKKISELNGLYLFVFIIIGIICLFFGAILTINTQWFYNDTYSLDNIHTARILMLLLTLNLAISFPASVFSSYITSQERFIFQKLINTGKSVFSPAFNIIVLYMGFGSIGLVLCTTIISLTVDFINITYCIKKLHMKICFRNMDFTVFKSIFAFSAFIAINQLVEQLNFQTDKIVLSKIVGASAVTIYSIGSNLNNMYVSIPSAISNVFAPRINMIVSKTEDNMDSQLNEIFVKVGRIQWFVVMLLLSGFIFFGKKFIFFWVGTGYENSYYVALLLMVPMAFVLIESIGIEIQRAKNKHQIRSIVYLIMAILNVVISIQLAAHYGEIGSALGTTVSIVLCPILFMNYYYYTRLDIDIWSFWKNIIKTLPSFIVPFVCGISILILYDYQSLFELIILMMGYTFLYCISVYFLGLNSEEKMIVKRPMNSLVKRK